MKVDAVTKNRIVRNVLESRESRQASRFDRYKAGNNAWNQPIKDWCSKLFSELYLQGRYLDRTLYEARAFGAPGEVTKIIYDRETEERYAIMKKYGIFSDEDLDKLYWSRLGETYRNYCTLSGMFS